MISFNCKCLAGNCIFGVGNGDTGVGCGMCSGLTTRKPEQCLLPSFWCIYCELWAWLVPCSGVYVVTLGQVNASSALVI